METLFHQSQHLISKTGDTFHRNLYYYIDWNCRLIEIFGARGVGKTTLMLQKAKEFRKKGAEKVLYTSLDDPYFFNHSILEIADDFQKFGGVFLFLDEVHKYPSKHPGYDWSAEIKVIFDKFPELKIIYSGSSVLQLFKGHGDLSRRKCSYNLPGLSFREYIKWNTGQNFNTFTLRQILEKHVQISGEITEAIKIIPLFNDYLRQGYYPYYHEAPEQFYIRLRDTVNVILEQDLNSVAAFAYENQLRLKKLLGVLCESAPFTPNLTSLRSDLYISDHRTLLNYLNTLEKAELLSTLDKQSSGIKRMHKPSKIYLNNTNLAYCLSMKEPNKGMLRETFFFNQVSLFHQLTFPKQGDFLVDNDYTFEIGGKNKSKNQIKDIPRSILALDDIETGFGNKVPLWLFGFLY